MKQDTVLQIRINKNQVQLVQEQLGDTTISSYTRDSLANVIFNDKQQLTNNEDANRYDAVSYTHLTLPTKRIV